MLGGYDLELECRVEAADDIAVFATYNCVSEDVPSNIPDEAGAPVNVVIVHFATSHWSRT